MLIKNIVKHFILITKHKYKVFILCTKAGIPVRGLLHDLSKYSPTEFFESVKYYNRKNSPIANCKKENGYSKAWLHHFGRNKHHHEYCICDIVLGKHNLLNLCKKFRFILFHPKNLGCGESGKCNICSILR